MAKPVDIFKMAVEKAVKNGYKEPKMTIGFYLDGTNYYSVIFDKEFAKAIWETERKFNERCPTGQNTSIWFWHLERMLSDDEPLKYLEKNLNS